MRVLSLFDGMSCGQIALNRAGIDVDKYYAVLVSVGMSGTYHDYLLRLAYSWGEAHVRDSALQGSS